MIVEQQVSHVILYVLTDTHNCTQKITQIWKKASSSDVKENRKSIPTIKHNLQ